MTPHAMITEIEDYFSKGCGRCNRFDTNECSTRKWSGGLNDLRRLCRTSGLTETVKWGHPCYMHGKRNITLIGAFRDDFRLNFFNAALMKDPKKVLEKQGPNTTNPGMIRFTDNEQVALLEPVVLAYLREAISYAEAGILPPKDTRDIELPDELVDVMDSDPELAGAFYQLTPGRQRSYVINLSGVKSPATRIARIAKFRDKIISGKGATDR